MFMYTALTVVFVVHIIEQKSLIRWYGTVSFYILRFSWMGLDKKKCQRKALLEILRKKKMPT
jgi:hypothetical protein